MKAITCEILAVLIACTFLVACRKNEVSAEVVPRFITKEGQFPVDGNAFIKIYKDDNGLLNVSYHIDQTFIEWTEGVIDPGSEWFVYVERRNEAWIAHDDTVDCFFDHDRESGNQGLLGSSHPELLNEEIFRQMPLAVKERLPLKVKQRIEEAQQAGSSNGG